MVQKSAKEIPPSLLGIRQTCIFFCILTPQYQYLLIVLSAVDSASQTAETDNAEKHLIHRLDLHIAERYSQWAKNISKHPDGLWNTILSMTDRSASFFVSSETSGDLTVARTFSTRFVKASRSTVGSRSARSSA